MALLYSQSQIIHNICDIDIGSWNGSIQLRWHRREPLALFSPPTPNLALALANASELFLGSLTVSDHVHADLANWTWMDSERKQWRKKFNKGTFWQKFADKWRNVKDFDREDLSGPSELVLYPGRSLWSYPNKRR